MSLPNIMLVILDDLGVEKFQAYGFESGTAPTPNFDALAQQGVLFERGYAAPICGPTRSAILSGRYAFRTGFGTNILATDHAPNGYRLPPRIWSLPRMLNFDREGTYAVGAFGKWHMTYNTGDDAHPNNCGYEQFAGVMTNTQAAGNGSGPFDWRRVVNGASSWVTGPPFDVSQWQATVAAEDAKAWISEQERPWFAYVALNPPHAPFGAPPLSLVSEATREALGAAGLAPGENVPADDPLEIRLLAYDAMIEAIDTVLGDLAQFAKEHKALLLVTGDNGTPGDIILPPFQPQHAKRTVFEQGIHVPMLAVGPNIVSPGRRSPALVHVVDMYATIAEATGATISPTWPKIDSVSQYSLLTQPAEPPPRNYVFAESFRPNGLATPDFFQQTIVQQRYKYINFNGEDQFYDLQVDPTELDNKIVSGLTRREQLILQEQQAILANLLAS